MTHVWLRYTLTRLYYQPSFAIHTYYSRGISDFKKSLMFDDGWVVGYYDTTVVPREYFMHRIYTSVYTSALSYGYHPLINDQLSTSLPMHAVEGRQWSLQWLEYGIRPLPPPLLIHDLSISVIFLSSSPFVAKLNYYCPRFRVWIVILGINTLYNDIKVIHWSLYRSIYFYSWFYLVYITRNDLMMRKYNERRLHILLDLVVTL